MVAIQENGKTTIRGGYGFLSDWLGTSTFEQTLRVDGYRLQNSTFSIRRIPILVSPARRQRRIGISSAAI
jgi:hypothetical protein